MNGYPGVPGETGWGVVAPTLGQPTFIWPNCQNLHGNEENLISSHLPDKQDT